MNWRVCIVVIALFDGVPSLRAEEALPLDAEAPFLVGSLPARSALSLSSGLDADGPRALRYSASAAGGIWRLGLAGSGTQAAPRAALGLHRSGWQLVAGGLGGDWGQGLLLGARRRGGLGLPRAARPAALPLAPAAGSSPVGRGLLLARGGEGGGVALALLAETEDEAPGWPAARLEAAAFGLRWRGLNLDLLSSPRADGLALGAFGARASPAAALALELGLLAPRSAPLRRALAWRLELGGVPRAGGLRLAAEGLLLAGPRPTAVHGWLGAAPGEELHAALGGPGPGSWRWRLARRVRRGLGLAADTRRNETALLLEGEGCVAPLLVECELRQIEERRAEAIAGAPGFPRREERFALRQELAMGIAGRQGPALRWRRRLGESGVGTLLQLAGAFPGLPRLRLSLLRYELEPGAPSFLVYSTGESFGSPGAGETRALAGRGWQLSAQLRLGAAGRRALLSGRYGRREDGSASWSLGVGLELARARAPARD